MRADDSRERPNDRDAAAKTSKCEDEDEDDARVVGRQQEGLERGGGGAGQLADGSLPARELLWGVSWTCRGHITDI